MNFNQKERANLMDSRELWQSVMNRTEKEIQTGRYTISFSQYEVYQFPKPALLNRVRILCQNFLMRSAKSIFNKLKIGHIARAIKRLSHA